VATDTCILINFSILDRLDLLGALPGLKFLLPESVVLEVRRPEHQRRLRLALEREYLGTIEIADLETLSIFAELRRSLGGGEAACLAVAATRGWIVASDEKRAFLREAQNRLGPGRVLNTPGLLVLALRAGLMTVEEADRAKHLLEEHRFRMRFSSFAEILGSR
jgi:predicted nucleic acid-binding protein